MSDRKTEMKKAYKVVCRALDEEEFRYFKKEKELLLGFLCNYRGHLSDGRVWIDPLSGLLRMRISVFVNYPTEREEELMGIVSESNAKLEEGRLLLNTKLRRIDFFDECLIRGELSPVTVQTMLHHVLASSPAFYFLMNAHKIRRSEDPFDEDEDDDFDDHYGEGEEFD